MLRCSTKEYSGFGKFTFFTFYWSEPVLMRPVFYSWLKGVDHNMVICCCSPCTLKFDELCTGFGQMVSARRTWWFHFTVVAPIVLMGVIKKCSWLPLLSCVLFQLFVLLLVTYLHCPLDEQRNYLRGKLKYLFKQIQWLLIPIWCKYVLVPNWGLRFIDLMSSQKSHRQCCTLLSTVQKSHQLKSLQLGNINASLLVKYDSADLQLHF